MAILALTDLEFELEFQMGETTPSFKFTDSTDFASFTDSNSDAIDLLKTKGNLRITNTTTSTVIYDNYTDTANPDFLFSNGDERSDTKATAISLPLNSDDSLVEGDYLVEYSLLVNEGEAGELTLAAQFTYNSNYDKVSASLSSTVSSNLFSPLLTAIDETDYTNRNIAPTISTRSMTVYFQGGTPVLAPVTAAAASVSTDTFKVGKNQMESSATLEYDFTTYLTTGTNTYTSGNLTVLLSDVITGTGFIEVADAGNLCNTRCCIKSLWQRMNTAKTANPSKYQLLKNDFNDVQNQYDFAISSQACGDDSVVNQCVTNINEILNCDGCSDCDGDTAIVSPISGGTSALGTKQTSTATVGQTSVTWSSLINKTWTGSQEDFSVFIDSERADVVSHDSTTGTVTWATSLFGGELIVIIILR